MHIVLWMALMLFLPTLAHPASPVSAELYAEVDHGLKAARVLADPGSYQGRTLLLGGRVERTVSDATGVIIEIDGYQLAEDDRPETPDPTLGRFVATGTDLDGGRLQPGRLVTLVGRIEGKDVMTNMAHLEIRFIYPWPTPEEEAVKPTSGCVPGYCCDPWWSGPGCDPWYWGPYPRWRFDFGYYRHRH